MLHPRDVYIHVIPKMLKYWYINNIWILKGEPYKTVSRLVLVFTMALATVRPCHGHGAINYLNNVYFKLPDNKKKNMLLFFAIVVLMINLLLSYIANFQLTFNKVQCYGTSIVKPITGYCSFKTYLLTRLPNINLNKHSYFTLFYIIRQ